MSKKITSKIVFLMMERYFSVPVGILAPKLTLVTAKKLAVLHNMHMPSKILLQNAQILLGEHKCQTCDDVLAVFILGGVGHCCTWHVQVSSGLKGSYLK